MTPVPVASITDADALFLDQVTQVFGDNNLPFEVLAGDHDAINTVINKYAGTPEAVLGRHGHNDHMTSYTGPLLAPVQEAVQAFINAIPAPSTVMEKIYASMGLDRKTHDQKLYDQFLKH